MCISATSSVHVQIQSPALTGKCLASRVALFLVAPVRILHTLTLSRQGPDNNSKVGRYKDASEAVTSERSCTGGREGGGAAASTGVGRQ